MVIPEAKYATVRDAEKQAIGVQQQYLDGAITNGERNNKVIQIWSPSPSVSPTRCSTT